MKNFNLLSLMFIFILLLAACSSNDTSTDENNTSDSDSETTEGDESYSVGINVTYPPFEYEEDGEYKGIDIDIIKAIGEDQDFEIEFEAMDFSGIIPSIQTNELDMSIAGMSITDERAEVVDFSDPYFEAGITLVVNEDNDAIDSAENLEGQNVVVKTGTTSASWAEENKGEYGFEITQVSDSASMFQEVTNGTSDALIEDYPVIAYAIAKDNLNLKLVGDRLNEEGDYYGMAVMKGENEELMEKLNDGLANIKDSGEYDKILDTYIKE